MIRIPTLYADLAASMEALCGAHEALDRSRQELAAAIGRTQTQLQESLHQNNQRLERQLLEDAGKLRLEGKDYVVQDGDNLELTTGRAVYANCRIGEIRVAKGDEFLELRVPGGEHYLRLGQAYGDAVVVDVGIGRRGLECLVSTVQ